MRFLFAGILISLMLAAGAPALADDVPASADTEACLDCHRWATPGIVADWKNSRHSQVDPAEAMKRENRQRRVSANKIPGELTGVSVGCAECHRISPKKHADTFEHEGVDVHVVVTPTDCATCHPEEVEQYGHNKMAWAYTNLMENPLYRDMIGAVNRVPDFKDGQLVKGVSHPYTEEDSCLQCHGTVIEVTGTAVRESDLGDVEVPVLSGWPNQGTGRINPDGSRGSCTACHPRHHFSIKTARQPYTCGQCHKGPDAIAYKVYQVSKHGNIYQSEKSGWDFESVPWTLGRDFTAPTCAACHISLVVDAEEQVVAERTHQMNDRLPWRLFGLPYAHPQPKDANTSIIENQSGLPLPTELNGAAAENYLIDQETMNRREAKLQRVCMSCHAVGWVKGHFNRLTHSIESTNQSTRTATDIIGSAWAEGLAKGPASGGSIFDEYIERLWAEHWFFYANSTRLASAMGGADYGVFAGGRWQSSQNLRMMLDWLNFKKAAKSAGEKP